MKKYLGLSLLALLLSFGLTGCIVGVTDGSGLSSQGSSGSVVVVYRVELSGNASLNSVQWLENGSTQMQITNTNFTRTIRANPGDTIYLTADASAPGGTVRLSYEATRGGEVIGRSLINCDQASCPNFVLQDTLPN